MARTISASVGEKGANRRPDAIVVQELLNKVAPEAGGPVPKLAVDGLPWARTIAAIRKFQKEQCGFAWPDGRVDPGGKTLFEANGHQCYDGNAFCFRLAQATQAEVMASIHLQWYWSGEGPKNGMHFGDWNGLVFTWGPPGNIIATQSYSYKDKNGPPPPGTPPT